MKKTIFLLMAMFVLFANVVTAAPKKVKVKIVELENKGTIIDVKTPDWVNIYIASNISKVQAQPEFKDKYCIIGDETGVNKQFVLAWADNFSAQQRIGAMLRTGIASKFTAKMKGGSISTGGANSTGSSGELQKEIDNALGAIINVSYSGAQREADWWSLRRRYDPDKKKEYSDEYTAYILYTIPKAEMNKQVAHALETSVSKDSPLYDITIDMVKEILQDGIDNWGAE